MPPTLSRTLDRYGLDAARAAFLERLYRGRSVLFVGVGDGAALAVALARGAEKVCGVDIDEEAVAAARTRVGEAAQLKCAPVREAVQLGAPFDVVMVRRGETMVARDLWREVSKLVRPGGWLVAAALAGDREGAPRGAMAYARLAEHLGAYFPHVTMLAEGAFAGAALIPYGGDEVEPVLDVALAPAPAPELYVAVAGPEALSLPYGLVELPDAAPTAGPREPVTAAAPSPAPEMKAAQAEIERLRAAVEERDGRARKAVAETLRTVEEQNSRGVRAVEELKAQLAERDERLRTLEEAHRELAADMERQATTSTGELHERLAHSEHALEAARVAALSHAEQMRATEVVLAERDAYVEELERDLRSLDEARQQAQRSTARADEAEAGERAARRRVAELEGTVLRLRAGAPEPSGAPAAPASPTAEANGVRVVELSATSADDEEIEQLRHQVTVLQAKCDKLAAKAADSEREAWGHLKARSEAEAAAAEVREDTVRKLKDARKIANVELMRAMEEATRKAVTLKEELVRTERERKEALAQVSELSGELSRQREASEDRLQRAASEEAARVLASLEARVIHAEGERDEAVARARELESGAAASALASTALEVEDMLGDVERSLRTETARVNRIEESLTRALEELRRDQGGSELGGE